MEHLHGVGNLHKVAICKVRKKPKDEVFTDLLKKQFIALSKLSRLNGFYWKAVEGAVVKLPNTPERVNILQRGDHGRCHPDAFVEINCSKLKHLI